MGSFEIFFIKSIHLQRFKFFRNMWSEVKLLHFNKVTFSVEKLLKGEALFFADTLKEIFNWFWKDYFREKSKSYHSTT